MKKAVLITALVLTASAALADDTLWIRYWQQGQEAGAYACATAGTDIYVAGTVRMQQTPDILVVKYTSSGDTAWVRNFDIDTTELVVDIAAGSDGAPVLCTRVEGTVSKAGIVKLTATGDTVWTRHLSGVAPTNLALGSADDVYVWGVPMDTSPEANFTLAQYASDGTPGWVRALRLGQNHRSGGCCSDRNGDIIATGTVMDSLGPHQYIVKFNPSGDTVWTRSYSQLMANQMLGVAVDPDNNIIATAMAGPDLKVIKCDSSGNLLWVVSSPESPSEENRNCLATDSSGNIVLHRRLPGENVGLLMLRPDGNITWQAQTQVQGSAYAVAVGTDNYPVAVGRTSIGMPSFFTVKFANGAGIKGQGFEPVRPGTGMCRTSIVGPDSQVMLDVTVAGQYSASLFSPTGARISTLASGTLPRGGHSLSLADTPAGAYLLAVAGPAGTELARIIRIR